MKNGINVLSCFDGLAGGLVALKRAGIKVNKYYAFEIDKYAIKVATKNHPEIVELGDINNWKFFDEIEVPDLIVAGSPCQGFSVAGRGLNFEDPRSKLFFVFVDILNYWKKRNPKVKFMLENVRMKEEWKNIISQHLGVEPVLINSALVSAQNRQRLYWTNWQFPQPEDRGLVLRDILEDRSADRDKSYCVDVNYFKGGNEKSYFRGVEAQLNVRKDDKSNCVVPSYPYKLNGVVVKTIPHGYVKEKEEETEKYPSLCAQSPESKHLIKRIGTATDINGHDILKRIYSPDGKSPTLDAQGGGNREPKIAKDNIHYRKLTPLECERLQTLPECDIIQSLWQHIMRLLNQNRTCVPAEISNGRLIAPAGIAERDKLSFNAELVEKSFLVKNPLNEFIAPQNADIKIEVQILKCTQDNSKELNWSVGNAEQKLLFLNREQQTERRELSALLGAFTNLAEAKIVVNGLVVLHLRDKDLSPLQNGELLFNRYGNEIKKPVKDVVCINQNQNTPTIFTTLSPLLLIEKIEQIQTILYFYAQNAIDGFTLKKILIDGCWTCPITGSQIEIQGYTSGVSNTQRYRMIGNGWTIEVVRHIFSFLPEEFYTV